MKLSFADEVRILVDGLLQTPREKLWKSRATLLDRPLNDRLEFMVSDFHFGKVSDIADQRLSAVDGFETALGGEVLDVTPSIYNYASDNASAKYVAYVKFSWKPSPYSTLSPAESWPVSKVLQSPQFEGKQYTRYATYTVTVTLQGKSRTYNTWALFRTDDRGKLDVYFLDPVADPTAILFAHEHSLMPAALLDTDLRSIPFVDKWLTDNALSCTPPRSDKDAKVDVCCDPHSGRCGVATSSLGPRSSIAKPSQRSGKLLPAAFHISRLPKHEFLQSTAPAGCAKFNVNTTFPHGLSDSQEHNSGVHTFSATVLGSCSYTDGATSPGPCNVQCSAQSSSQISDAGSLSGLVFIHATAKTDSSGGDFSNGGATAVECLGLSGGTVKSCTIPCSTSISITAGGKGNLGATVSFPAEAIWNDQNQGKVSCQPQSTAPTPSPTPAATPNPTPAATPPPPCDPDAPPVIRFGNPDGSNNSCSSPIIIDTSGKGFQLSSAGNGAVFDIAGSGTPVKLGWPVPGSGTAFLTLPGADGLVHNGTQLFGNFTPQPTSDHPNGFLALRVYDQPDHGGNGDGVIDEQDRIFTSLRLWLDDNHDGICQPRELHTLPELGVLSLSLDYSLSRRTDDFGNLFRYRGDVNHGITGESGVSRKAYDVFLITQ